MPTPEARPGPGAVSGSPGAYAYSPDQGTLALRGNFTQTQKVSLHLPGSGLCVAATVFRCWFPW